MPSSAPSAASAGASHTGSTRIGPSAVRPAHAAATSSTAAGRKSAISHASHSVTVTPPVGGETPRESARSMNGPVAIAATAITSAHRRDRIRSRGRIASNRRRSRIADVAASAPAVAVKGPPMRA